MITVTNENFKEVVLDSEIPVLVDFWAPWCGPCKALTPTVEQIASEYDGKIKVVKINIDDAPELANEAAVMSIPTLVVYDKGAKKESIIGLVSKDKIVKKFKNYL
ncbi:MAG: thioredoxin [Candidatus Cloacimonetes bacterium 4572_65]|nr:MAG: thioredoxin [Candidatus Cloacimonetes bacterium 4572_65]